MDRWSIFHQPSDLNSQLHSVELSRVEFQLENPEWVAALEKGAMDWYTFILALKEKGAHGDAKPG